MGEVDSDAARAEIGDGACEAEDDVREGHRARDGVRQSELCALKSSARIHDNEPNSRARTNVVSVGVTESEKTLLPAMDLARSAVELPTSSLMFCAAWATDWEPGRPETEFATARASVKTGGERQEMSGWAGRAARGRERSGRRMA